MRRMHERGQSTTENILIIDLVVLVAVAAMKLLGINITAAFQKAATEVGEAGK